MSALTVNPSKTKFWCFIGHKRVPKNSPNQRCVLYLGFQWTLDKEKVIIFDNLINWFGFGLYCSSKATFIWIWFLFQVCEYFHVARHLIKHWTKIVKSHNKKTIEDFLFFPCNLTRTLLPPMWSPSPSLLSQLKLLRGQLLLEEKMSAPPTGCMLLYNLSISPSCLPLHQGLLLPRLLL